MTADTTRMLLSAAREGEEKAADLLFERVYDELRHLSSARIAAEGGAVTLSATGLVHEAYIKLIDGADWNDRAHFLAIASRAMRQILVDRARARRAIKRGGGARPVQLHEAQEAASEPAEDLVALDEALDRLALHDVDLARLVELRFFGGLDVAEAANVMDVSVRTAGRLWARAKAHLRADLR